MFRTNITDFEYFTEVTTPHGMTKDTKWQDGAADILLRLITACISGAQRSEASGLMQLLGILTNWRIIWIGKKDCWF